MSPPVGGRVDLWPGGVTCSGVWCDLLGGMV